MKKEFDRKAGVLLNISSLPGPFGIGVFGKEAEDFIDSIKNMGFSYWQILPLGTLDHGNSPYCGESALAGNELYIDPRGLFDDNLIDNEDISYSYYPGTVYTVDYDFVKERRRTVIGKAFDNFQKLHDESKIKRDFNVFIEENPWVVKYGEFKALKDINNNSSWASWKEITPSRWDVEFYEFTQFIFFRQWKKVKDYANSQGVKIIGDMPLYISYESADVYGNPEIFQLDKKTLKPEAVSGVPPDYFSEEGQLWGNPLYNWKTMKKNGYKWWKDRILVSMKLYDVLRIDHFRGLASYWSIPFGATSAKEGHWEKGPGMDLFKNVKSAYENGEIIAEDLGVFGEDVYELLDKTGFAGMRVIQFAFDETHDSIHLPHKYRENTIAYIGTHDNNTLLGYLWDATPTERQYCLDYCGFKGENWGEGGKYAPACRSIIETVWKSGAKLSIISVQDMCGFGKDTRMNIPGVPNSNWRYRTTGEVIDSIDVDYFKKINELYGRK